MWPFKLKPFIKSFNKKILIAYPISSLFKIINNFLVFFCCESQKAVNTVIFFTRQGKSNRNTDSTKVQYALTLTEFVFHCLPNASPHCPKKKGVSCMETLMSHFPMKGQNFAHLFFFYFFSLHVLPFTMIFFLFNWLVSSFFLTGSPLI